MTRTASASRGRMLEATEGLLREGGLGGAGIQQVVARSGAPIGSVYHFFPGGKSQLVAEALQIHGERARALFERILHDRTAPIGERIRTLFRTAAAGFDRAGANKGCAIGAVSLDLSDEDETLRVVCRAALDTWIVAIAHELPCPDQSARRSFAEMIVAGIEGAFVLARARKSGAPFVVVGDWLAAMLDTRSARAAVTRPRAHSRTRLKSSRHKQRRSR